MADLFGPSSQARAHQLITVGYVGMRVRSITVGSSPNEINLVMWKCGASRPAKLMLIDDDGRLSVRGPR